MNVVAFDIINFVNVLGEGSSFLEQDLEAVNWRSPEMLKFQVLPGQPQLVSFITKGGQPAQFFKQSALVTFPDGSMHGVEITPPKGQPPYTQGQYQMDDAASFYVSQGRLNFNPKLIPAAAK